MLDLAPLRAEAELLRLEHEVCVLATRHLVVKHGRVGCLDILLKALVQLAHFRPVQIQTLNTVVRNASTELHLLKRAHNGTHGWLRGQTRHAVDGSINDIGTRLGTGQHTSDSNTSRIVGVNVDRQVRILGADGAHEQSCRLRLKQASHILNAKYMQVTRSHKLIHKPHVVVERVLGVTLRVRHVTCVADCAFHHTTCDLGGVHAELERIEAVERVEYAENVQSVFDRALAEFVNGIVRVRRIAHSIRATDQCLERNVRNQLTHRTQTLPWVLIQETHGNIERGTSPALQTVRIVQSMRRFACNVQYVQRAQTRR